MDASPHVSVAMPVYNAERYLVETVESILSQTFRDFELVAVDDGSTDGSLEILKQFAERDSRLRIISRRRTGIVGARNDGLASSRGEWIAAIDNDDVMLPDRIGRQVDYLRRNSGCVAVGGAALLIDPDGDPLFEYRPPIEHGEIEGLLLRGHNPMVQPAVMFRAEAVRSVGGYHPECEYSEDFDLFLRLCERGRLANLPRVVLKHRQHLGRASFAHFHDQRLVLQRALQEAYRRRGLTGAPPDVPHSWHPNTWREFHIRCCCDAWDGGFPSTARKHATALFRTNPFSPRAWDLLARTYVSGKAYRMIESLKKCLRPLRRFRDRSS